MTQQAVPTIQEFLAKMAIDEFAPSVDNVLHAYYFARQAHKEHRRVTGESYSEHELGVADVIHSLEVDATSILVALLHDVLAPHTGVTSETLRAEFGSEIASLVEDIHELRQYTMLRNEAKAEAARKAAEEAEKEEWRENGRRKEMPESYWLEDIRQSLLTIIEGDIRVLLVRMADCIQDLRTAELMPEDLRLSIAEEGMQIYAPLANRLGIWQFKWELEDLSFRYLQPDKFHAIAEGLQVRRADRMMRIEEAVAVLQHQLDVAGYPATVTGRPKHIYSIYRKMQRKNLPLEEIYDQEALRVVLDPVDESIYANKNTAARDEYDRDQCYLVLGQVYGLWKPIPEEFDDYITSPKPNGYKSLHTAVTGIDDHPLEVQIRSHRMHIEAEKGIAAHWAYKEDGGHHVSTMTQRRTQSMRELIQMMKNGLPLDNPDLIDPDLEGHIYVFTPQNQVIELPRDATPIDFAYAIHTGLGHRCRRAYVNGKMVTLSHRLKSGDRVEIGKAKHPSPNRDWMNPNLGFTTSARTRSKIRSWFRQQERGQNIEQGRQTVERELKRLGLTDTFTIPEIAEALNFAEVDDFLAKVGFGDIHSRQINGALALLKRKLKPDDELRPLLQPQTPPPPRNKNFTIAGMDGLYTRMAKCCNPIPPERIVGYVTRGQGVTIHRKDCKEALILQENENERIIEVSWGDDVETYPVPIRIVGYGGQNLIEQVLSVLRLEKLNVPSTKTTNELGMTTFYLVIEVPNLDRFTDVMTKLSNLANVEEVGRQRWN